MKPQLYSIVILLLTGINYAEKGNNSTQDAAASGTQPPLFLTHNTTSVAKPSDDNVTPVTEASGDHKTSTPETTENNVTSATKAPNGNTTSVASRETIVSKIPTVKVTLLSEVPNSQATSAPSLAPNASSVGTTKGFTTTTGSGDTPRATESTSISIGNQTSSPIVVGNATTRRNNKVTNAVRKTTRLTSTKSTIGNRTSAFPVPSLFAIVLLVVSVLCF